MVLAGCASAPALTYKASLPTLRLTPMAGTCHRADGSTLRCVVVAEDDWRELVREVIAACLAGGYSSKECGATD